MSLIGRHTLNPTTDPAVLASRATCTAEGHRPVTFNPWHGATWCRCGELVVAGDHGVTPAPRKPERHRNLGGSPVWDDLDMRSRYLADQGWSADDIAAVLGR